MCSVVVLFLVYPLFSCCEMVNSTCKQYYTHCELRTFGTSYVLGTSYVHEIDPFASQIKDMKTHKPQVESFCLAATSTFPTGQKGLTEHRPFCLACYTIVFLKSVCWQKGLT